MTAYYNEIEPYAADWLRELIRKGHIADGVVDTRSIVAVEAADLRDFDQCHFFAGIGVWSHALRLAGWPDDRPVWTGSCPCQPFSAAGKGKGFEDERHLWPEFHRLISECKPPVVFGEQVASKDGLDWLDTVFTDLEATGYAAAAADMCAAGIGAPHIRQRLWFVGERTADTVPAGWAKGRPLAGNGSPASSSTGPMERLDNSAGARHLGALAGPEGEARDEARLRLSGEGRGSGGLAYTDSEDQRGRGIQRPGQGNGAGDGAACERLAGLRADGGLGHHHHKGLEGQRSGHTPTGGRLGAVRPVAEAGEFGGMADTDGRDTSAEREQRGGQQRQQQEDGGTLHGGRPSPTNGHWRDADWLHCRDGKWRPVEPGTFPLAHGTPARVGRLRAYGNAIVPQVAAEVISAFMEARR